MYLPASFAENRLDVLRHLLRSQPLGLLVTHDGLELQANAVPWLLDEDPAGGPGILRAHVARANPLWRQAGAGTEALVVFQGPQAYVSPNWYPSKALTGREVPTWNYCMAQARGRLEARDDPAWVLDLVSRLSDRHESGRPGPWSVDDAPPGHIEKLLGAIVGIEIKLTSLRGKWKVSQNKPPVDRDGVARGLEGEGGEAACAMAREVRSPGGMAGPGPGA